MRHKRIFLENETNIFSIEARFIPSSNKKIVLKEASLSIGDKLITLKQVRETIQLMNAKYQSQGEDALINSIIKEVCSETLIS